MRTRQSSIRLTTSRRLRQRTAVGRRRAKAADRRTHRSGITSTLTASRRRTGPVQPLLRVAAERLPRRESESERRTPGHRRPGPRAVIPIPAAKKTAASATRRVLPPTVGHSLILAVAALVGSPGHTSAYSSSKYGMTSSPNRVMESRTRCWGSCRQLYIAIRCSTPARS